jgi:hypothetical protein
MARVTGPTKNMSHSACRLTIAHCGVVARIKAVRAPASAARRRACGVAARTCPKRQTMTPRKIALSQPTRRLGRRIASSTQGPRTSSSAASAAPTPKRAMERAMSQKGSAGLDQKVFSRLPSGPRPGFHQRSRGSPRTRICRATSP